MLLLLISIGVSDLQTLAQSPTDVRGYMTTPAELAIIAAKAESGLEPYASAVHQIMRWTDNEWDFRLRRHEDCDDADSPAWLDNSGGMPILYSRALAYHLTGDVTYAQSVVELIGEIISSVETISLDEQRCRLTFSWGIPELIASADLVAPILATSECTGPLGYEYIDDRRGTGNCRTLFQNWLAKNPFYVISLAAEESQSNWGASATNALAHIADYLWDRRDITLLVRVPIFVNDGQSRRMTPAQAYAHANQLMLDRNNGFRVEYGSLTSCDFLAGDQQNPDWEPVKSQITENGIIPEDARREQYCNIQVYNGNYMNYPQIYLGHNIQQCELMLRRGDASCYENVDMRDIPNHTFIDPNGETQTTHLRPGRGSIERAINAVIIDSRTEWRHDSTLEVAFRYYYNHRRLDGFPYWFQEITRPTGCEQAICFGTLTHGFAPGESLPPPPVTAPPA